MSRSNRNVVLGTLLLLALLGLGGVGYRALRASGVGEEGEQLSRVMGLRAGQVLADVGAWAGEWSFFLAAQVGPTGVVFSTEVDEGKVLRLRRRAKEAQFHNVTVLLGDQDRTGLEGECCDGILLRRVYHHFEHPAIMLEDLRSALKPGGVLALIDFSPTGRFPLSNVPAFRHGHGVPVDTVAREIQAAGFEEIRRIEPWMDWNATYCLVFRKSPDTPSSGF